MTKLDDINRRILRELQQDGRITNADLAAKVGLSASACLRRVQELERDGVIAGYRAVVNRSAMGGGFTAYVAVGLSEHHKRNQRNFEKAMSAAPQVRAVSSPVVGRYPWRLHITTTLFWIGEQPSQNNQQSRFSQFFSKAAPAAAVAATADQQSRRSSIQDELLGSNILREINGEATIRIPSPEEVDSSSSSKYFTPISPAAKTGGPPQG